MLLPVLFALAAAQTPSAFIPSEPKNFGPYRNPLPRMPPEIANQPVDVRVGIELLVDPSGVPKNCRVLDGGSSPAMADWLCVSMWRRSRFVPAKDQNALPVHSYYTYWKTFGFTNVVLHSSIALDAVVPVKSNGKPLANRYTGLALLIDASGKVEGCKVVRSSGLQELDVVACSLVKSETFPQTTDEAGGLVRTVRTFSVGYRSQ
jgi:hypothetical protein